MKENLSQIRIVFIFFPLCFNRWLFSCLGLNTEKLRKALVEKFIYFTGAKSRIAGNNKPSCSHCSDHSRGLVILLSSTPIFFPALWATFHKAAVIYPCWNTFLKSPWINSLAPISYSKDLCPLSGDRVLGLDLIWTLLVSGDAVGYWLPDVVIFVLDSYHRQPFTNFPLLNSCKDRLSCCLVFPVCDKSSRLMGRKKWQLRRPSRPSSVSPVDIVLPLRPSAVKSPLWNLPDPPRK